MFFSIVVVSLNAGKRFWDTINSILHQSCLDYEVIVKDGGSTDGVIEKLAKDPKVKIISSTDNGIYDGMNQGIVYIRGQYCIFMNCGDVFYNSNVLSDLKRSIMEKPGKRFYYGDCLRGKSKMFQASPRVIKAFTCYRTALCHQACIYETNLLKKRKFNIKYKISADHELLLHYFMNEKIRPYYLPITIVIYEGGGVSEKRENQKKLLKERKYIQKEYFSLLQRFWYSIILILSLRGLRRVIIRDDRSAPIYQKIREIIYSIGFKKDEY